MGSVSFTGLENVKATLEAKLSKKAQLEALEEIGDHLIRRTVKRINNNEVKPKTSLETLKRRRRKKSNDKGITLADTGALLKSIKKKVIRSKMRVLVGSNKSYARIQQLGGRTGRKRRVKLPARPYLFWTSYDRIIARRLLKMLIEDARP